MAESRDRAVGALMGLAVGDAVGTTLEFKSPGTFTPIDDMVGGGPFRLPPGAWTDDTSMAMCLAESIVDTGGLDPVDQMRRYVMWREAGYWSSTGTCFDIGIATSTALARFARTGEAFDPQPNEEAASNGSLMRLAAVPIRWHADIAVAAERSAESSGPTHPATRPTDACRLLGAMTAALVGGLPADHVFGPQFWSYGPLHPEIEALARCSWRSKQPPEIQGRGYAVAALEAALWAVGGASDYRDAVLRAANLGDDADTTAAIAGQLAGARWGMSGIPAEWRSRIVATDRIMALGERLYEAATGDMSQLWSHDDFIHAWWVEPGIVLAGEYPGNPDQRRAAAKVNLLIDHGVRTFVDLTTDGDHLSEYESHIAAAAQARQLALRHVSHPIPDLGVVDDGEYDRILATIRGATSHGGVYIHCWGGVGRTATVVGCLLIDNGLPFAETMTRLTALRRGTRKASRPAPETGVQLDLLRGRDERRAPGNDKGPG